jgi:hypothetical protein
MRTSETHRFLPSRVVQAALADADTLSSEELVAVCRSATRHDRPELIRDALDTLLHRIEFLENHDDVLRPYDGPSGNHPELWTSV